MSDEADEYSFYLYNDLVEKRIVSGRTELANLIDKHGFPRPLKAAPTFQSTTRWRQVDVHRWIDDLAARQGEPLRDSLTAPLDRPRGKRGRPRKTAATEAAA